MNTKNNDYLSQNKVFLLNAAVTGLILLIPLVAMQFTSEVAWTLLDFTAMGIILFGFSSLFVLVARVTPGKYRLWVAGGFLLAFLITWIHLAVGIVDTWPLAGS